MSQITVDDGTTVVNVDADATLGLRERFSLLPGGSKILRTLNGTGIKQQNWQKKKITISANGWAPSGLWDLDYGQELTLTVMDPVEPSGTKQYTVFGSMPDEEWDVHRFAISWTQEFEEV